MTTLFSRPKTITAAIFGGAGMTAIIARRMVAVVLLFAVLDIAFVLVTYTTDRVGLGQHLLSLQADEIAEAVAVDHGKLRFDPAKLYREPIGPAQLAFAVYDRQGREIAVDGPWDMARVLTPPITAVTSETRREDHASGFVLSGVRKDAAGGEPVWVSLMVRGEGLRPFWPVIANEIVQHVGVPLLPLVVLLLALNVTLVYRAVNPLMVAAREADALDPRRIEGRLTVPRSPTEAQRLVGAVNHALDRIENAIRTLREFTGDAAHELRTPLTVMSMAVDELPPSPAKTKLQTDVAVMTRSVGQMLDMASADAIVIPAGATADLSAIAAQVVSHITPLALRDRRQIRFIDHHPTPVEGHSEAIGRALRNLIENALKHSPDDTAVDVIAGPGPVLAVRDHGPGIPPEKRALVTKRFWRGNRSRNEGSGLGLAIASRIAEAHGGSISITDTEGGGALIKLRLGS